MVSAEGEAAEASRATATTPGDRADSLRSSAARLLRLPHWYYREPGWLVDERRELWTEWSTLQREHPGDFAAMRWLIENEKGMPTILEASGNPYSYYARFSSNTGIPTVLGWGNHEGLWRDHEARVSNRSSDVKKNLFCPKFGRSSKPHRQIQCEIYRCRGPREEGLPQLIIAEVCFASGSFLRSGYDNLPWE